jgi:hypothetical protein
MRSLAPVILLASACNQGFGAPEVHRGPCDPGSPFVYLAPVAGLGSQLGEQSAQLSRDELTIVFSRVTIAGTQDAPVPRHGDLYMAHRDHLAEDFHDAVALNELNTELDERTGSLSDDKQTLYFDRQDPSQRYQIFAASRSAPGEPFGAPTPIALRDHAGSDIEPFFTPSALFFASRSNDGSASLFTADGSGTSFAATRQLASLEVLPAPTAYEHPVVSSDGLTIYFSAPPDSAAQRDIWRASRSDPEQPFGSVRAVAELNTISAENPTWISEDSCRLYFMTNRSGQGHGLWLASRTPR